MPASEQTWINGEVATALPLPDRGLDYGDGLFETMPVIAGDIPWLGHHLDRLRDGLQRLGFPEDADHQARAHILEALDTRQFHGVMRLTVTRGSGPRGYAPIDRPRLHFVIQLSSMETVGQPALPAASIGRSSITLSKQPALAGIKHLNRLEQVLAARERQTSGFDEMLMTDNEGNAISAISGNLFLVSRGQLLTPTLINCGILGTRRRLLLEELAPALGFECRETTITEADVQNADEVLYCNSVRGFQPVGRYGGRCWQRYPTVYRLQALYRERLHTCGA